MDMINFVSAFIFVIAISLISHLFNEHPFTVYQAMSLMCLFAIYLNTSRK